MRDEIVLMYMVKIVEQADHERFFAALRQPDIRALLLAVQGINRPLKAPETKFVEVAIHDLPQPQSASRFGTHCRYAAPA